MTHFLLYGRQIGGHVHVDVWAGTGLQAENHARPQVGRLVMDPDQWESLKTLLETGMAGVAEASVEIEEDTPVGEPNE